MKITPFAVEQWMNEFETKCRHNLGETCVASLSIEELLTLAGERDAFFGQLLSLKLTYGEIKGSERLRAAIAALYESRGPGEVLVTHGAIGANALIYQALVGPGEQVVSVTPTYQQHYSIPESLGADVRRLELREANGYLPDLDELRSLVTPATRLIAFTNPNNPTGSFMDGAFLQEVVAIAQSAGAYILADEVYRGTAQEHDALTPSVTDLYARGISVGSMSKAFSLAGLRLGWICGPADLIAAVEVHRDYNTISVGMVDDLLAAIALEHQEQVLARSRHIVRENLSVLERWVAAEAAISFVKPRGGTVALLKYDLDLPSHALCVRLVQEAGVLYTPGIAFEREGTVRIGYANTLEVLKAGLAATSTFLKTL